ncbi:MAG: hypothetical protein DCC58_13625 [Chloroflexi bacterium]|nr:MAG: hypothetical protein DCC58_13625 [Chloroflexota bacterium]
MDRQLPVRLLPAQWGLNRWEWLYCGLLAGGLLAFLAAPWSLESKSLAALHGLCAQNPTHSFFFGNARLPFDARMTGIYGGVACTALYLFARGRWRYGGIPSVGMALVLACFIVALALDGMNSFLRDIQQPYLYTPRNELRLVTGLLTGTTLAVFIWMLIGQVAFARSERTRRPVLSSLPDLGPLLGVHALFFLLVWTRWEPLRVPLTLLLLMSAVAVVSGLALGFVILLGRREGMARTTRQLAGPATVALLVGVAIIAATSGSRFLLEAFLGLPAPS